MRKIIYVTGSRADFGLMKSTLLLASNDSELDVSVCVTGMHLSEYFGNTVQDVVASGIEICARIPVSLEEATGAAMGRAIGNELIGIIDTLENEKPDLVVVLGDRGEMLAGALAAIHLNIPVAHIHGGELSGTVDEPVRHAISKLSHFHFTATAEARERLIRMGENADRIHVCGAPGLDGLTDSVRKSRQELFAPLGFDLSRPTALFLFHSLLQEEQDAALQVQCAIEGVLSINMQVMALAPNADAGGQAIRDVLETYRDHPDVRLEVHMARNTFVSWMAAADVMVGNSSSGIIEAASLGLPVVNIGDRQRGRQRSENVIDARVSVAGVTSAVNAALASGRREFINVYGDGHAGERVVDLLKTLPLTEELLHKSNAY